MNTSVKQNLDYIQGTINNAADKTGRNPKDIKLMAVTKTKPSEMVMEAYRAGHRLFGENRVFEARDKYETLPDDIELHLIGHLQRNKAKTAVSVVEWIDSIDKLSTVQTIEKQCELANKELNILIEVNTSGEASKSGVENESALWTLVDELEQYPYQHLRGLMTIGPLTGNEKEIRNSFRTLRTLYEELKKRYPNYTIDTLSMGMSSDYTIAIEEGSTMVRVGSLIFGSRE